MVTRPLIANQRAQTKRRSSSFRDAPTIVGPTIVGTKIDERVLAESFAEEFSGYEPSQLAKAAHRSKEIARQWLKGDKAPNAASLLSMAQTLPGVWSWMAAHSGRASEARSLDAVMAALYGIAAGSGAEAMQARQIIALCASAHLEKTRGE